jgi:ATP-binding cassette, subfamily C (CFTR/MRP), member 1
MVRGGVISLLYKKAGNTSLLNADPSSSVTLMSADIERIVLGMQSMHEIWSNAIEIGVAIYLLKRQLGIACMIPVAVAIGRRSPKYLQHLFSLPDQLPQCLSWAPWSLWGL